jgi:MFS family permease
MPGGALAPDRCWAIDTSKADTRGRTFQPTLATLSVAAGLLVTDYSIVNVALSSIRDDLGFSSAGVQWVVTAYALPFGGLLLLGGRAADLYGRRRMLMAGLLLFGAGLVLAALAWERSLLIGARAIQGVGAALAAPAVLAVVTATHPVGRLRRRAVGIYGAVLAAGFAFGVVAGALVTAFVGWRGVFLAQLPVVAAVLISARTRVRERRVRRGGRLPATTAALVTGAFIALTYGLSEGGRAGWTSPEAFIPLALAAVMGAAVPSVERRSALRLVPACAWRRTNLLPAACFAAVSGAGAGGAVLLCTLYLRDTEGYGVLATGAALLPLGLAALAAGLLSGPAAERLGDARMLGASLAVQGGGTGVLAAAVGVGAPGLAIGGGVLIGAGHVGAIAATATIGTNRVPEASHGTASGVLNTALEASSAVGIALLLAVASIGAARPAYAPAFAAGAVLLLGAAFEARQVA